MGIRFELMGSLVWVFGVLEWDYILDLDPIERVERDKAQERKERERRKKKKEMRIGGLAAAAWATRPLDRDSGRAARQGRR